MKSTISKTILSISIAVAVSGAHAGTLIDVDGVQPGDSIDTLNVKGANPGSNIFSVDSGAGNRVFNVDEAGKMFITLGNTDKATRFVMQNQQSGALETSGKLENQDNNVLGDGDSMDFIVRKTDADGIPTGEMGEISEEGMSNFIESLIETNTTEGGISFISGDDLGDKLDGDTSTEAETLYLPVQDGEGNKGYVSEADLTDLIDSRVSTQIGTARVAGTFTVSLGDIGCNDKWSASSTTLLQKTGVVQSISVDNSHGTLGYCYNWEAFTVTLDQSISGSDYFVILTPELEGATWSTIKSTSATTSSDLTAATSSSGGARLPTAPFVKNKTATRFNVFYGERAGGAAGGHRVNGVVYVY